MNIAHLFLLFLSWLQGTAVIILLLLFVTVGQSTAHAAPAYEDTPISEQEKAGILQGITDIVMNEYVFPEVAERVMDTLNRQFAEGEFDHLNTRRAFTDTLDYRLRMLSEDGHLALDIRQTGSEVSHIKSHSDGKLIYNHAFEKVEILRGNIGYLKFNKFHTDEDAWRVADAAFALVSRTEGLIIDLRETIGGSPYTTSYFLSYFFAPNTPLWRVYDRNNEIFQQVDAFDQIAGKRFPEGFPVFVLTGPHTASAAEIFAYSLQQSGKAKTVGKTTMGIAHYTGAAAVGDNHILYIPQARPLSVFSQQNWEGHGVKPDIQVPLADSLDVAHEHAIGITRQQHEKL